MPAPKKKPGAAGNQDPPEDDDEEAPDFTERQLEIINNTITSAVSQHVKRHMKPLTDQLAELPTIRETLEQLANGQKAAPAPAAKKKDGKEGEAVAEPSVTEHPEMIEMRKKVDALTKERQTERLKSRDEARDRRIIESATTAGVDKNRLRGATALLRDQVKYDREGNPIMTVKRGGVEEDVDIETGAAEFFKTDEGKAYLAPTAPARGGTQQRTSAASVAARAGGQGGQASSNAPVRGRAEQNVERKVNAMKQLGDGVAALLGDGGAIDL